MTATVDLAEPEKPVSIAYIAATPARAGARDQRKPRKRSDRPCTLSIRSPPWLGVRETPSPIGGVTNRRYAAGPASASWLCGRAGESDWGVRARKTRH